MASATATQPTVTATATISTPPELPQTEGCVVWRKYSSLAPPSTGGGDEDAGMSSTITVVLGIVKCFHEACRSTDFVSHIANLGFSTPSFHPNIQNLKPGNAAFDRIAQCLETTGSELISSEACLGVVFHGTATGNIPNILINGLDPNRRSGQAYGKGEYFSKEPGASVSYCKGGLEMLVFLVIFPDASKRQANCPEDYVVVENNAHQIPLGTLKFTRVDHGVLRRSINQRKQFLQLSANVFAKSQVVAEAKLKAKIIQDLVSGKIDLAADYYTQKGHILNDTSKKEISWYAHQAIDSEVIFFYFPEGLPDPLEFHELNYVNIPSVDFATRQEQKAKRDLEEARQRLAATSITIPLPLPATVMAPVQAPALLPPPPPKRPSLATSSKKGNHPIGSDIVQYLIQGRIDIASELYLKHYRNNTIDDGWKDIISTHAFRRVDDPGLVLTLFPNVPYKHAAEVVHYLKKDQMEYASQLYLKHSRSNNIDAGWRNIISNHVYKRCHDISLVPIMFPNLPPPPQQQQQSTTTSMATTTTSSSDTASSTSE